MLSLRFCVLLCVLVVGVVVGGFDIRDHLASLTPYENRLSPRPQGHYDPPEGCQLVSLDMVLRHGSRYPTDKNIIAIEGLRKLIDEYQSQVKMDWMKSWQPQFSMDIQGLLCPRGVDEHRHLGINVSRFFHDAVLPYSPNEVKFTCTYKDRTSQSAESFGNGMVNDDGATPIAVTSASKKEDLVLRFFDNCPRYTQEVKDNPHANVEKTYWMEKNIDTLANIIKSNTGLPIDGMGEKRFSIIDAMWSACQSEYVVYNISDKWCSVFGEDGAKIMEFYDDLDAFYKKSYGHEISYMTAAPLLADIIENMRSNAFPVENDVPFRGNLRFGHAETILPFVSLLGLFHSDDEVLTANMTWEKIDNRKFRFGAVSPLATNVAFVQYRCEGKDETEVELLHNGYMYPLRGCTTRLCPLSTIINSFNKELEIARTFTDYCKKTSDADKEEL